MDCYVDFPSRKSWIISRTARNMKASVLHQLGTRLKQEMKLNKY
jgi:hypothetical protein